MRGGGKPDENQAGIVDCLRRCGCRVAVISLVGGGVPDLLVGTPRGQLILIEVKNPNDGKLNPAQREWHAEWRRYPIFVVRSEREAVDAIGHDCTSFDIDRVGKRTCSGCRRELAA